MKYIKTFEYMSNEEIFVGYHCNECSDIMCSDDFIGYIKEEYYERFSIILESIKHDYIEADEFILRIENGQEEFVYESDLVFDIMDWFDDNNINWIFVSNDNPNLGYGNTCYEVYFKNTKYIYSVTDTAEKDATIYIYIKGKNEPILKIK